MWLFNLAFPCSHLWNGCLKGKQRRNWGKTSTDRHWKWCGHSTCSYTGGFVAHSLPLDYFLHSWAFISTGHLTRGTCTRPVSKSWTGGILQHYSHPLKKKIQIFPHQPLSAGRKGTGPAWWLIPLRSLSRLSTIIKYWGKSSTGQWKTVSRACLALMTNYLVYWAGVIFCVTVKKSLCIIFLRENKIDLLQNTNISSSVIKYICIILFSF